MTGNFVLVVDDDEDVRTSITELLSSEGYDVASAANGLEALDLIRDRGRPAVILLDLMMPIMDGHEFLARRYAEIAHVPVVLITAAGPQVTKYAGAERVLTKPISASALLAAVEQHVGGAAVHRSAH
jgi:CheY-like chemotaxis protein